VTKVRKSVYLFQAQVQKYGRVCICLRHSVYLSEAQEQKYRRVCICLRHSDKSTEGYVSVSDTVTKV